MKAYDIIAKGRVQRVGFRRHVIESAHALGIRGYVRNEDDGTVYIFAQGEDEVLKRFIDMLKAPPDPAHISDLYLKEIDPKPEVTGFRMIYGELVDELQEGFGAIQSIFVEYLQEFRDCATRTDQNFSELKGELRDFANRTDQNFSTLTNETRCFSTTTNENFNVLNTKYDKISDKLTVILEMLVESNKRLEYMQKESEESRNELKRSVDALVELVKSKL